MVISNCEDCLYNDYDEENNCCTCRIALDQDEFARGLFRKGADCRRFQPLDGEDYAVSPI